MPDIEATGSLNKVPLTTEEHIPDLGLLFFRRLLSPPRPRLLSVSIFLICQFFFSNLFALFLYIFRTLAFFAILFKRYCGERYTSAVNTRPPSLLPSLSFLNCSLSKKVASRCVLNYCDTHRQVHYLYGESAFLKG